MVAGIRLTNTPPPKKKNNNNKSETMGDRTLSLSLDTLNDLAETENKKATV